MKMLLIRHALPLATAEDAGHANPELSDIGWQQAKALAAWLETETIDAIYASPMHRARQTAEPLAEALGIDIAIEDDIAESDRDGSSYVPVEQRKAAGDDSWRSGFSSTNWSAEHEPLEVFHARIMDGLNRIITANSGNNVAVFCHGGVISRYISTILSHPADEVGFFYPLYTSVSRVAANSAGLRSVLSLNEVGHLRGTGLPTGGV